MGEAAQKKKMLVPGGGLHAPLVYLPAPLRRAALCGASPPPPPPRRPRQRRLIRCALLVGVALSVLPYFSPKEQQPWMYKDGMDAEAREKRDRARRVTKALYP